MSSIFSISQNKEKNMWISLSLARSDDTFFLKEHQFDLPLRLPQKRQCQGVGGGSQGPTEGTATQSRFLVAIGIDKGGKENRRPIQCAQLLLFLWSPFSLSFLEGGSISLSCSLSLDPSLAVRSYWIEREEGEMKSGEMEREEGIAIKHK